MILPVADQFAGFLLELVFKGALVMAAAFAINFALRGGSAALRHAVWRLAFIGLLLLPVGSALLPAWEFAVPEVGPDELTPVQLSERHLAQGPEGHMSEPQELQLAEGSEAAVSGHALTADRPYATESEYATSPRTGAPRFTWSWLRILSIVWLIGAVTLLGHLLLVLVKLSMLRRRATPVANPRWMGQAECISDVLDIRRPIEYLQHEAVSVPMTYGVRKPVVFLPSYAADWSREQMHTTLMHELLHVKRNDHFVQILALSTRALHWFNPLAWLAVKRLVVERERACDDRVLEMGVESSSYADHLLELARKIYRVREAPAAVLAMARPSELHTRIVSILDPAIPRRSLSGLRAAGVTGCALILLTTLAAVQPANTAADQGNARDEQSSADGIGAEADLSGRASDVGSTFPAVDRQDSASMDPGSRSVRYASEEQDENAAVGQAAEIAERGAVDRRTDNGAVRQDTTDLEAKKRAIHAISELPASRSVPLLSEIARTHPIRELRKEAIFWLGEVGTASVAELLETIARSDDDAELQQEALFALSQLDDGRGISALADIARTHSNDEMRAEAVFWIGQEGGEAIVSTLEDFARHDESVDVQKKAVIALSEVGDGSGVPFLIELARNHANPDLRAEAIFWLGESGDERAADVLMEIVNQN